MNATKMIGTVLPTKDSLECDERHFRATESLKRSVASKALAGLTARRVGWETRYYKTESKYAVVNSSGKVLWFETRNGNDYAVKG